MTYHWNYFNIIEFITTQLYCIEKNVNVMFVWSVQKESESGAYVLLLKEKYQFQSADTKTDKQTGRPPIYCYKD